MVIVEPRPIHHGPMIAVEGRFEGRHEAGPLPVVAAPDAYDVKG